jgi:hypothetical protein
MALMPPTLQCRCSKMIYTFAPMLLSIYAGWILQQWFLERSDTKEKENEQPHSEGKRRRESHTCKPDFCLDDVVVQFLHSLFSSVIFDINRCSVYLLWFPLELHGVFPIFNVGLQRVFRGFCEFNLKMNELENDVNKYYFNFCTIYYTKTFPTSTCMMYVSRSLSLSRSLASPSRSLGRNSNSNSKPNGIL